MKAGWWGLPEPVREAIGKSLEEKFAFLIDQLGVKETREIMSRFVPTANHPAVLKSEIQAAGGGVEIVDDGNPNAD